MKTFKNLLEAQLYFKDEKTCWAYWEKQRWNGTPVCPHCATVATPYKLSQKHRYKCSDKDCGKKFTALVGTIFESTKLPLQKWFLAIYLISAHKKGISSLQLHRDLGITQKSAWFVLHRVREMLASVKPEFLEGIVEADETYVGGKVSNWNYKKRKAALNKFSRGEKTAVVGLVQREGKVLNVVVKKVDRATIGNMVTEVVKFNSTLITDSASAYTPLKSAYTHEVVNHAEGEYYRNGFHTNTIEGYWGLLKRGIYGIYHSVSPKHLQRYCDEFAYRYNTRQVKDVERFNECFVNAEGKRLTYKRLIQK